MNNKVEKLIYNTILVTGGCGFIGTNFIRMLLSSSNCPRIVNLDCLTYAGHDFNLKKFSKDKRYTFVEGKIQDEKLVQSLIQDYKPDALINFAAESHVDRSIDSYREFYETNVGGTLVLLDAALRGKVKRFLQVSTDEVYGSRETGYFTETSSIKPSSPYAASKASADCFVESYHTTYGMDTVITRCTNNYGPYQNPEKFIPLIITNLHKGAKIPVYGDGMNKRNWIYVDDHCRGVISALNYGKSGQIYNFAGPSEKTNIDLVKSIIGNMGKSEDLIEFVDDRLGHDFRYALDDKKARNELAWSPEVEFSLGINETLEWYENNAGWINKVNKN